MNINNKNNNNKNMTNNSITNNTITNNKMTNNINNIKKNSNRTNNNISNDKKINSENTGLNNNTNFQKNLLVTSNSKLNSNSLKQYIIDNINNIGIKDLSGSLLNPLNGKEYSPDYITYVPKWSNYPVYAQTDTIIDLIKQNQVLLLVSGTGSGKSVLVPKYALHATNYQGKVVITNPKTKSTRLNAQFAAKLLDVTLGKEVGYQYRGASLENGSPSKSNKTKLLFSTDGSVVAQMLRDPYLKEFSVVIVDEAHERVANIDIILLLMKRALKLNPELKLIIMSATIDEQVFINYFSKDFKFARIEISSKPNFPVDIKYINKPTIDYLATGIDLYIKDIVKGPQPGDSLFFVNSTSEGTEGCQKLNSSLATFKNNVSFPKPYCFEIGAKIKGEKEKYLETNEYKKLGDYDMKIIFATNQVESSVTIDTLLYVIDNGFSYVDGYDPMKMERKLLKQRISKDSAKQRTGRAGRTKPGTCYRLYTEQEFNNFPDHNVVDIKKNDVTNLILNFLSMNDVNNIKNLKNVLSELIEPPENNFVSSALNTLYAIGCITGINDNDSITNIGLKILQFRKPGNIQLSLSMLRSFLYKCDYEMADLAAILTIADGQLTNILPEFRTNEKNFNARSKLKNEFNKIRKKFIHSYGDHLTLYKTLILYKKYAQNHTNEENKKWCKDNFINYSNIDRAKKLSKDIHQEARKIYNERNVNYQRIFDRTVDSSIETEPINIDDSKFNNKNIKLPKGGSTFINDNIHIHSKLDDNLMQCIFDSFYIFLARKLNNFKFLTTFPHTLTIAEPDRSSTFNSTSKTIIYYELADIFGREKFNIVSKVPQSVLKVKYNDVINNTLSLMNTKSDAFIKFSYGKNKRNFKKQYKSSKSSKSSKSFKSKSKYRR